MRPRGYKPVMVQRRHNQPKPVFSERRYGRSAIKRLTPLSWFLIVVGIFVLIGAVLLVIGRINDSNYRSMLLSERLGETVTPLSNVAVARAAMVNTTPLPGETVIAATEPTAVMTITLTAAPSARVVQETPPTAHPAVTPLPTIEQTATLSDSAAAPTPVKVTLGGGGSAHISLPTAVYAQSQPVSGPTPVGGAPWAAQLVRQPDGSLIAPPEVVAKAELDISGYYTETRDLAMEDYLAKRDKILARYFTGDALKDMQDQEKKRTQYERNRAGTVTIIARSFTLDGYTAKAGIYLRNWVTDDYDVSAKTLLRKDVAHPDILIVMTITYDKTSGRWMYSALADIGDLKPKP